MPRLKHEVVGVEGNATASTVGELPRIRGTHECVPCLIGTARYRSDQRCAMSVDRVSGIDDGDLETASGQVRACGKHYVTRARAPAAPGVAMFGDELLAAL